MRWRKEKTEPDPPAPFFLFPEDIQLQLDASLKAYLKKTTIAPSVIEPFLRAQLSSEILPPIESTLVEQLDADRFKEFISYGDALLQTRTQYEAKTITPPYFFNNLRGSIPKPYKTLRNQMIAWLCLRAFAIGGYQPYSNLNILTWAKAERNSLRIPVRVPCPACSNQAQVLLHCIDDLSPLNADFACSSCSHAFKAQTRRRDHDANPLDIADKDRRNMATCECELCKNCKAELLECIRSLTTELSNKRFLEYRAWRLGLPNPVISRQTMFRDHEVNKNNLRKDVRLILSLKPQTADDFMSCIQAYERDTRGSGGILVEAAQNKVIYETYSYNAPEFDDFQHLLAMAITPTITEILRRNRSSKHQTYYGNQSQSHIARSAEASQKALESVVLPLLNHPQAYLNLRIASTRIYFSFDENWILLHDSAFLQRTPQQWYGDESLEQKESKWQTASLLRARICPTPAKHTTLNYCFLENGSQQSTRSKSHRRLFNSDIEQNAYQRLAGTTSGNGCIVVPNRVFYQLLTRDALHDLEIRHYRGRETDWLYVRNCELDLVIYDSEGYLVAVEEVQRGDHHNQSEWIRKDSLKREALALAGISFRESF